MSDVDNIIAQNQSEWDDNVEAGDQYTSPWLDLDEHMSERFANGELSGFHKPCGKINHPLLRSIRKLLFTDIRGKKVLCLASGGGQQSVVFSLLGAEVTVADISKLQLDGDVRAASHYGYAVKTVQCSMTDLSVLEDGCFDIVYQPVSMCFVPDVLPVYKEVFRVLKAGGLYEVDHVNPATYPTSFVNSKDGWDGTGYRIASPYLGGAIREDENGDENMTRGKMTGEFRHLYIDMFCNLTAVGFQIKYIWEDERNLVDDAFGKDETGQVKEAEASVDSIIQRYIHVLSQK